MLVGTSGSNGSLYRSRERAGVRAGFIPLSCVRERAGVRVGAGFIPLSCVRERAGVRVGAGFIPLSCVRERAGVRVSAGARPVGLQPIEDAQPHRLTLHQHLAVGEAQHVIAELVQFSRAPGVGSHALRAEMLTPIEFDDQHRLDAREVGEVPAHRVLSSELVSADLPIAQGLPQRTLGVGRALAQLARPVGGGGHRLDPHPGPLPRGEGMNTVG